MSKRTLEKDIEPLPRARYLYVGHCADWDGKDAVKRTILTFTDLVLGARVHTALSNLHEKKATDAITKTFYNLTLPYVERDEGEDGEEEQIDEKTRQLFASVGPECIEKLTGDEFGTITNGFYYFHQG